MKILRHLRVRAALIVKRLLADIDHGGVRRRPGPQGMRDRAQRRHGRPQRLRTIGSGDAAKGDPVEIGPRRIGPCILDMVQRVLDQPDSEP